MNILILLLLSFSLHAERVFVNFYNLNDEQVKKAYEIASTHALIMKPSVSQKNPHIQFSTIEFINNSRLIELFKPLNTPVKSIRRQITE